MGKKAKEHRKKIAKRNEEMKLQIKKAQNAQKEALMQLIERERQAGAFNNPVQSLPGFEGPNLGIPVTPSGPQI